MADLPEEAKWENGIYQWETSDPVVGGAPNPATGEGIDNIPTLQLANRTKYLKERFGSVGGVGLLVPNADLDALRITSTHVIAPGDTGNPLPSHYGTLLHTEGPEARGWQMAQMSNNRTYTRTRYKTSQAWSDWEQLWGSSDAQTLFQSNGYRIAPDGLIIQWGSGTISNGGPGSGAFPIAFPNACYQVLGTDRGAGRHIIAMDGNQTNWTCWSALAGGGFASSTFFRYIATGN